MNWNAPGSNHTRHLALFLLAIMPHLLGACATVFNSSPDQVLLLPRLEQGAQSDPVAPTDIPARPQVELSNGDDTDLVRLPAVYAYDNMVFSRYRFRVMEPCFEQTEGELETSFHIAFYFNILYPPYFLVDLLTGDAYVNEPKQYIPLRPVAEYTACRVALIVRNPNGPSVPTIGTMGEVPMEELYGGALPTPPRQDLTWGMGVEISLAPFFAPFGGAGIVLDYYVSPNLLLDTRYAFHSWCVWHCIYDTHTLLLTTSARWFPSDHSGWFVGGGSGYGHMAQHISYDPLTNTYGGDYLSGGETMDIHEATVVPVFADLGYKGSGFLNFNFSIQLGQLLVLSEADHTNRVPAGNESPSRRELRNEFDANKRLVRVWVGVGVHFN